MSKENKVRKGMIGKIIFFWALVGIILFEVAIIVDYSVMDGERLMKERKEETIVVPYKEN